MLKSNSVMKKMKNIMERSIQISLVLALVFSFNQCKEPASLNALIVSDADQQVTGTIQTILENSGLFNADINKSAQPNFTEYDVVVLNFTKGEWSDEVKSNFIKYVNGGGGVVSLGSSSLAFGNWVELNNVAGTTSGAKLHKSNSPHEFTLVGTKEKHPITDGLQRKWMHTSDHFIYNTETLTGDTFVLATALADTAQGGSGAQLPVLFTVSSGEGRVFQSTLGTAASSEDMSPMQCVGFITTLQRGAEWAATGVVSQEPPVDFPNSASTHEWAEYEPIDVDEILERAMTYKIGRSKKYLTDFSMRIRNCDGKPESYAMYEEKILDFLESDATVDSKKYMCRELSWVGKEKSKSVLEKLINDKDLSESASYALQRLRM